MRRPLLQPLQRHTKCDADASRPDHAQRQGKKVGGINTSRLTWSGATSNNVDINRNGVVIATDGERRCTYTDSTGTTGQASFTYKVCEAGTRPAPMK